eukprot:6491138-Amphidinium_carterae.2
MRHLWLSEHYAWEGRHVSSPLVEHAEMQATMMQPATSAKISKRHTYKLLRTWHKRKEVEFVHKPAERHKCVHGRPLKQRDAPFGSRH